MQEVNINCPNCQSDLQIPEALFGKVIRCPGCSKKLEIPNFKIKYEPKSSDTVKTGTSDTVKAKTDSLSPKKGYQSTQTHSLKKIKKDMLAKLKSEMNIGSDVIAMRRSTEYTRLKNQDSSSTTQLMLPR